MPKGYLVTYHCRQIGTGRNDPGLWFDFTNKREAKRYAKQLTTGLNKTHEASVTVDCKKTGHTVYEISGNCEMYTVMTDDSL